jgi:hypothetical protein
MEELGMPLDEKTHTRASDSTHKSMIHLNISQIHPYIQTPNHT